MELKLVDENDNVKKEGGLRLSGSAEERDFGFQTEQENPWDFDKPEEPIITHSISSGVTAGGSSYGGLSDDVHIIVKIGRVVVYVCMLLVIASLIWIATRPKIDIFFEMMRFSPLFSLWEVLVFVDAALVNILYERKISLFLWACLFNFFYPMKRDKHVNGGSSWGVLTCVGMLIAYVALVANLMVAFTTYGATIMNEDDAVRTAVAEFMEQPVSEGGEKFDYKLKKNFEIENIDLVTQGTQNVIVVQAYGQYGANTDSFIDYTSKTVATQLAFVKDSSGKYTIGAVVLDNTQLSDYNVNYYWNSLMK